MKQISQMKEMSLWISHINTTSALLDNGGVIRADGAGCDFLE